MRRLIETGKVRVDGQTELEPRLRLRRGARVELKMSAPRPDARPALDPSSIVCVDRELVVVRKPAGISTVPYDANETGTLDDLVRRALEEKRAEPPLGIVHRLDKETSGLLVFARTLPAKVALKQQFRFHTVKRRYVAIAHGAPGDRTFREPPRSRSRRRLPLARRTTRSSAATRSRTCARSSASRTPR